MFLRSILTVALLASPALAQDELPPKFQDRIMPGFYPYETPVIPTDEEKVIALLKAYRLNGNSMVGNVRMIDLTDPEVAKADKIVRTIPIVPTAPKEAPITITDVKAVQHAAGEATCRKHGMRTVYTHNGLGWRCK